MFCMKIAKNSKVAIVHDQLTQYGGAERTLETILDIFPDAHIFTGYCKPKNISKKILEHKIICGPNKNLGFLMPLVFESFDLRKYDIVISEGTAWPKGVLTTPEQLHINYICTPPRFLYGYATEGQKRDIWYFKPFLKIIDHFLRIWDFSAAQRPDYILSISQEVAKRVKKFYGRESHIIYPPVEISTAPNPTDPSQDYYLHIGRLAAYKNVDLLVKAFNLTNLNLIVAGTGKEEKKLKSLTNKNVTLAGFVDDSEKTKLLTNCKGFIFPTDYEDFGIVVVEALSYGKPVLCHRSGGPLEVVEDGKTGMFFDKLEIQDLAAKIMEFDQKINHNVFDAAKAKESAQKYSAERFRREFRDYVMQKWEEKHRAGTP